MNKDLAEREGILEYPYRSNAEITTGEINSAPSMTDDERLELGKQLLDFFVPDDPEGAQGQSAAYAWLEEKGFDRIEFVQGEMDDILLCRLWKFDGTTLTDEFIIEFAGHDSVVVSIFNQVREWVN